jgi:hypothetical protein
MHDTCATANLVAELMAQLRNQEGREFHGMDVWDGKENKAKPMFDFLCGNHTRNLLTPILNNFWQIFLANILVIYKIGNKSNGLIYRSKEV